MVTKFGVPATLFGRDFVLLWWAGLLTVVGHSALAIALPIFIFRTTGSALATGLMFAAGTLPSVLFASVAGVYVDRWDRRRTLVAANLLLAAGLLPLIFSIAGETWPVYLVSFVMSFLGQFAWPAENALLPELVEKSNLTAANALNALNNNLGSLMGPALGGLLMGGFGLGVIVAFGCTVFLAAGLLVSLIKPRNVPEGVGKVSEETHEKGRRDAVGMSGVWSQWLDGLRVVRTERVVLILLVYSSVTSVGEGIMAALFVPFVADVLRGGAAAVGWLVAAQSVGGIVGGIVVGALAARFPPVALLSWGAIGLGVVDAAIFNYPAFLPGVALGIVLFAVAGFPVMALEAGFLTLFQTNVSDTFLGRVFGAHSTTGALFNLLGLGLGGFLGDRLGIVPVINVQAVTYILGGLLVLTSLNRLEKQGRSGKGQ